MATVRGGLPEQPLWTCPRCGARLVTRNMWHACGPFTVEGFLDNSSAQARALFDAFVRLASSCGPITFAPARTRVAIMARTRFCAVDALTDASLRAHFALPYRLEHPRIRKIEAIGPWIVHHLTLTSLDQCDDELRSWLCESYRLMGCQQRFGKRPEGDVEG